MKKIIFVITLVLILLTTGCGNLPWNDENIITLDKLPYDCTIKQAEDAGFLCMKSFANMDNVYAAMREFLEKSLLGEVCMLRIVEIGTDCVLFCEYRFDGKIWEVRTRHDIPYSSIKNAEIEITRYENLEKLNVCGVDVWTFTDGGEEDFSFELDCHLYGKEFTGWQEEPELDCKMSADIQGRKMMIHYSDCRSEKLRTYSFELEHGYVIDEALIYIKNYEHAYMVIGCRYKNGAKQYRIFATRNRGYFWTEINTISAINMPDDPIEFRLSKERLDFELIFKENNNTIVYRRNKSDGEWKLVTD